MASETQPVQVEDVAGVRSRISWGAILGGTVLALACSLVLTFFFAAVGLSVRETDIRSDAIGTGAIVAAIDGPAQEQAFALSLINLADVRGVEVVAKGVESREQAWRLAELGCRYGQGFFFSKPLGATGLLAVLRQGTLRG